MEVKLHIMRPWPAELVVTENIGHRLANYAKPLQIQRVGLDGNIQRNRLVAFGQEANYLAFNGHLRCL